MPRRHNSYETLIGPWFVLWPLPVFVNGGHVGRAWTRAGALRRAKRSLRLGDARDISHTSLDDDPQGGGRHWSVQFSDFH